MILVVLLAISFILFVASWFYQKSGVDKRDAVRAADVEVLRDAIYNYVYDNGAYPGCLKVIGPVPTVEVQRCRNFVEDITKNNNYISKIPMDIGSNGWETGYSVAKGADNQVTVSATFTEGKEIVAARTDEK